ncbi:MAG: YbaK/EbsC family protein [Clostridiaceae bacterium]|nr:YbaK/EbsC family protein [Clostridiaceae bacterium]
MSYEKVKEYFNSIGLEDRVVVREHIGDTVENAAAAIGCEPARIAKTMSFMQNGKPALVVMAGDAKVNNTKYKACFQQKAVMIPGDQVEALIGHMPGAVCPFAINESVHVYLDVSLKRFDIVYTAGGSLNTTIELSLEELEKHSGHSGWIDVCKGWYVNEDE